jgi:hypothetical protein
MTRTELLRQRRQMHRRIRETVAERRLSAAVDAPAQPLPDDEPPPDEPD